MSADGRCDICGRFAGSTGVESYDDWQPDYWNGPRTTFRCARCEAKHTRPTPTDPKGTTR